MTASDAASYLYAVGHAPLPDAALTAVAGVRRVDAGDLDAEQEERIGLTLMLLEDRMDQLRERFGLRPEDLNIDLGPLGSLLPRS